MLIEWLKSIDAGVNENPVGVDMHQREIFQPDDMVFRNNLGSIVAGSLVTVGNQRLAPTVVNPPIRVQWFPKRLDHHVFVVALEADQRDPHFLGRHQMIDDLAALRATVDVIAERDDLEGPLGGVLDDRVKCRRQQIKTAVKVCNCVCEAHAAAPCASDHLLHMRNVTYRRAATGFSKFNRNYFMPLTPSTNAQVISDMGTFSFPMIDGETVAPVQVTDDTLEYMASRDHTHLDEPADLFDQYRGEVEAAASAKYDKGHEPRQAVIVTLNDL